MACLTNISRVIFSPHREISPAAAPGPLLNVSVSSKIVFPAPLGPTMASTSPSFTVAETSRRTRASGSFFTGMEYEMSRKEKETAS